MFASFIAFLLVSPRSNGQSEFLPASPTRHPLELHTLQTLETSNISRELYCLRWEIESE